MFQTLQSPKPLSNGEIPSRSDAESAPRISASPPTVSRITPVTKIRLNLKYELNKQLRIKNFRPELSLLTKNGSQKNAVDRDTVNFKN